MTIGYLVKWNWHRLSGLAGDDVVYDLAYRWVGAGQPAGVDYSALRIAIGGFFTGSLAPGATLAMDAYHSGELDRTSTGVRCDIYAIPDAPANLGSPVYTSDYGPLGAAADIDNIPSEVACRLSMNADLTGVAEEGPLDTRPRARRRGGFYLGPFNQAALAGQNTVPARPAPTMISSALAAADFYLHDAAVADDWDPVVWSRTDWSVRPVVRYSMDDAFDTIRSRGPAQTTRTGVNV